MPVKEALSGLEKGLDCLNADLATFKEKLGDLLGMMVPSDGKEGEVDQESDAVNEVSTKLDATIEQLVKDAKDLRVQIEMLEETPSTLKASDGPARRPSKEEGLTQDEVYAEVDNLRSNLSEVTIREKERVEGLSVQLEMARQELADTRNQRRLEQASLAAAESQSSQLRAALTCAEDDIKSLRLTLDNELVRSQRLQSQLTELGDELRASRRRYTKAATSAVVHTVRDSLTGCLLAVHAHRRLDLVVCSVQEEARMHRTTGDGIWRTCDSGSSWPTGARRWRRGVQAGGSTGFVVPVDSTVAVELKFNRSVHFQGRWKAR
jgi:chromosome segregation ATPase